MSDVTGEVYEYRSIDTPLFCGKSGLFLVVDENPYKEECYVRVYKMLPEGRLAEVAALNRGGGIILRLIWTILSGWVKVHSLPIKNVGR